MPVETFTRTVATADPWQLILDACHYAHEITSIDRVDRNFLYQLVYLQNDGYGPRGFIPSQGYDWSGIRDSSPEAHRDMANVVRNFFTSRQIATYTVNVTTF